MNRRVWLAGMAVLATVPLALGGYPLHLATEALCWAIAAAALDLLVGYAGLVPLGHIAMWGLGAYACALIAGAGWPLPAALLAGGILPALYAALTAPLALRAGELSFLMVTLAFAQMLRAVADRWSAVTGGTDGMTFTADVPDWALYGLTLAALGAALLCLSRLVRSPFGRVLEAARQNPRRASALGYPVRRYQLGAVVIASVLIGVAGALAAAQRGIVTPGDLSWLHSVALLIMVLVGGARSLWGPVLGALLYTFLQAVLSSHTTLWAGAVGALLIGVVLSGGGGLWPLLARGRRA